MVSQCFYTLQCDHPTNSSNHLSPRMQTYRDITDYLILLFHPSSLTTNPLVSIPMRLFLFCFVCSFVLFCFYIPPVSKTIGYLSFSVWLTSLSVM